MAEDKAAPFSAVNKTPASTGKMGSGDAEGAGELISNFKNPYGPGGTIPGSSRSGGSSNSEKY